MKSKHQQEISSGHSESIKIAINVEINYIKKLLFTSSRCHVSRKQALTETGRERERERDGEKERDRDSTSASAACGCDRNREEGAPNLGTYILLSSTVGAKSPA